MFAADVNAKVKAAIDKMFSTSPDARDELYQITQYCDELIESLDDLEMETAFDEED